MIDFEKRLGDLFIELPEMPKTPEGVLTTFLEDKLLFVGMQLPFSAGKISFKGRLGIEVSLDQGRLAARHALFVCLSAIRQALGSLNKVKNIIQLTGFIASGGDFQEHDKVLDGASKLLSDIFGNAGKHTRVVVGVNHLPQGACVGLAMIVAVR